MMLDDVISADGSPSLQGAAALQTRPETVAFIRPEDRYNLLTVMADKPVRDFDDLIREAEPVDPLIVVLGTLFESGKQEDDKNHKDDMDKINKDQKDDIERDTGKEASDKDPKEASDKDPKEASDKDPAEGGPGDTGKEASDTGGGADSLLRSFALKNDNGLVDPGPADTAL